MHLQQAFLFLDDSCLYVISVEFQLCLAAAYCCAAHRSRLTAWLFGVFGAIGFASVANTFCHIRAHFLVSLLRTGIGLALGLVLGMLILLILRACWPAPSDATQTKE